MILFNLCYLLHRLLAKKGTEIKKDMIFKTGALKITVDDDATIESSDETHHLPINNNNNHR